MSLSLKAELETWAAALKSYDDQDFERALQQFSQIADSSKILTNMGLIYATIGEHEAAVEHFNAATNLDSYLAIAYFQAGVSNFLIGRYDLALTNFEDAQLYLRGNQAINYEQIGLKFKLFAAEVLFNKGLSQLYLGYPQEAMYDLEEARKEKVTEEHDVIDDAIRDRGEGYTVFSIPVGVLYRPSENKLKNSKSKDYLGKAKLVAASDSNDEFTEFTGLKKLQQTSAVHDIKIDSDAPMPSLSRSATAPAPRPGFANAVPRPTLGIERSKTIQVPTDTRERLINFRSPPSQSTIPSSRRSQSVSNPVDVLPLPSHKRSNTSLSKSNTTTAPSRPKTPQSSGMVGAGVGGGRMLEAGVVSRGMSVRRPQLPTPVLQLPPTRQQPPGLNNATAPQKPSSFILPVIPPAVRQQARLTEIYDDYADSYTDDAPRSLILRSGGVSPQMQTQRQSRILPLQQPLSAGERSVALTQYSAPSSPNMSTRSNSLPRMKNVPPHSAGGGSANNVLVPSPGINRAPSESAASDTNLGGMGGLNNNGRGLLRKKSARRPTVRRTTTYEEEDDGFVTGGYDEGPLELNNIRIKLHYQGDVRGMTLPPDTPFEEFVGRITSKFGTRADGLGLKFKDEDGTKITLRDESDYELALETARENARGRGEGKLEVWCVDI
ncbi:hypothetical protein PAXRUDRAFT_830619 [Paxillus rubicundulus Ve08.2h10]|uniref:PB1 domain-containing protein n=1 Tax=Paxillus rubicundulus Ve08.2h10 TaxID=930991 RepID=A0A0D0D510_9AGAM|nr:hypothetical protein PAXRUDRAFT_830619 [Paxillus rubicundulus Ve08.2h10]